MTEYNCNCDASAGAPDHARTCPQHRDYGKVKTEPQKPVITRHPLVNIAEWRKGCSCAPKDHPVQCEECTEGLIAAVENWFAQHRGAYPLDIAGILDNLDERAKGFDKPGVASEAAKLIRTFEADLYAAQDQVTGLQELMALPKARPLCSLCGTHEVSHEETCHNSSCSAYADPTTIYEGWKEVQELVSTDIVAEAQVIEDARVTQLLATLKRADGIISMLMPGAAKVFNLDIMELNEGMMEITQALAIKKGAAQEVNVAQVAATPTPPVEIYALPVDLVVNVISMPRSRGNLSADIQALGIGYATKSMDDFGGTVTLHGCTNVPVDLPSWLEVKK